MIIEAVELETRDGVVLRGEARIASGDWLVLVHAPGRDLDMWTRLVGELNEGVSALAVDLRGCGGSDGEAAAEPRCEDVEAMLAFARSRGAELVVVVAAGESCPAALDAATRSTADGVMLLGPGRSPGDPGITPRFIVAADHDQQQVRTAEALGEAPGWSLVAKVPVAENGAELVDGSWGTNVRAYINGFFRSVQMSRMAPR
jgi:pimeloyl-ACP methyl ester carboxylesterase